MKDTSGALKKRKTSGPANPERPLQVLVKPQLPRATVHAALPRRVVEKAWSARSIERFPWTIWATLDWAKLDKTKKVDKAGAWRLPGECVKHPKEGQHLCWSDAAMLEAFKRKDAPKAMLKKCRNGLWDEFERLRTYESDLYKLYQRLELKQLSPEEFDAEAAALHVRTFPREYEIQGAAFHRDRFAPWSAGPGENDLSSEFGGKLVEILLRDCPEDRFLPRRVMEFVLGHDASLAPYKGKEIVALYGPEGEPDWAFTRHVLASLRVDVVTDTLSKVRGPNGELLMEHKEMNAQLLARMAMEGQATEQIPVSYRLAESFWRAVEEEKDWGMVYEALSPEEAYGAIVQRRSLAPQKKISKPSKGKGTVSVLDEIMKELEEEEQREGDKGKEGKVEEGAAAGGGAAEEGRAAAVEEAAAEEDAEAADVAMLEPSSESAGATTGPPLHR